VQGDPVAGAAPAAPANGATTTVVSDTTPVSGRSVGSTRTPSGSSPAATSGERGGRSRTMTGSLVPG
jgi:hypothetical protein